MIHARRIVLLLLTLLLAEAGRAAEPADDLLTEPKWEAGLFLGVARMPLYRGSDDHKVYALPVPFLIYRGDVIQSDREGLRGVLFRGVRFESTFSFSGHPPVEDEHGARAGMPDLQPLLEAGPALKWWPNGHTDEYTLYMQLAARATASVNVDEDLATAYEGWRTELSLVYSRYLADPRWRWGSKLAAYGASRDFHRYFYDVPDAYATADRPAYDADPGYGGAGLSVFLTRKLRRTLTAGLYTRWDHIGGAVFEDSPLVRTEDSFTLGGAVIWRFAESSQRVSRQPDIAQ